jgi:hypothetical protein
VVEILAKERSDFTIEAQPAYRKFFFDFKRHEALYDELRKLEPPIIDAQRAQLYEAPKEYGRLPSRLSGAQESVAAYLRDD